MPRDVFLLKSADSVRALSHPVRIKLLSLLQEEGPATATKLADLLEESAAEASYHLRQLGRYGLIEESPGRGDGRERWWRAKARHYNLAPAVRKSEDYRAASSQLVRHILERDAAVVSAFVEQRERYEPRWRDAAALTNHVFYATPDELEELSRSLRALLAGLERPDPSERPEGAMRCFGVLRLVPWAPEDAREEAVDGGAE